MKKETLKPRESTRMTKVIMRKENGKQIIHFHEKYSKDKRPILIPLVSVSTCRMQTTTGKKKKESKLH